MLLELSIRDLALIEALDIELAPGLCVLTGETGAGKSLFVGSLELLTGDTPKGGAAQWVRKGAPEARVEGRVSVEGRGAIEAVRAVLAREAPAILDAFEAEIDATDPKRPRAELFLGRSLTSAGRTKAHIQQRPVPLRALRAVAPAVLEIHGQNDSQLLLTGAEQRRLLDLYGGLGEDVDAYRAARAAWLELRERLDRLNAERAERRDRGDLLRFQIGELEDARLEVGEHAELKDERDLLRNAADVRAELGGLALALAEDDDALLDRLRSAVQLAERWSRRVHRVEGPLEELREAEVHVSEAAAALASIVDDVVDDPGRLEEVEERLAELERLEAKYRTDEAGLIGLRDELAAQLDELERDEASLETLESDIAAALATLDALAKTLSKKRKALVPKLKKGVERTLASLGLEKARFDVALRARATASEPEKRYGRWGDQDVEFLLAANPGEDVAPLAEVASGGEAARIMLALRTELSVTTEDGADRSLVFDEIDSGVGGRLGPEVGAHLKRLAKREQVLCVTHIPAIAAVADLHLCVSKEVTKGRTRTTIVALSGDERIAEVADMIAGGASQETARAEARRLMSAGV